MMDPVWACLGIGVTATVSLTVYFAVRAAEYWWDNRGGKR